MFLKTKMFLALILVAFLLCGCGEKQNKQPSETGNSQGGESVAEGNIPLQSEKSLGMPAEDKMFTKNDLKNEFDMGKAERITLSGNTKVNISKENTYVVSGELKDASIEINAEQNAKIRLIFDGVKIEGGSGPAINVIQADKVFITLADGSSNYLSGMVNGSSEETNVDAVIFSKDDLTISGCGALFIESGKHGIVSKDDLVFTAGNYQISAVGHGASGKDSVRIAGATLRSKPKRMVFILKTMTILLLDLFILRMDFLI